MESILLDPGDKQDKYGDSHAHLAHRLMGEGANKQVDTQIRTLLHNDKCHNIVIKDNGEGEATSRVSSRGNIQTET